MAQFKRSGTGFSTGFIAGFCGLAPRLPAYANPITGNTLDHIGPAC
jgi:hypothetical protein